MNNSTSAILFRFIYDLNYFKHITIYRYIFIHFKKKGPFGVYPVPISIIEASLKYKQYKVIK